MAVLMVVMEAIPKLTSDSEEYGNFQHSRKRKLPITSTSSASLLKKVRTSSQELSNPLSPPYTSPYLSSIKSSEDDENNNNGRKEAKPLRRRSTTSRRRKSFIVPESDRKARQRCFDYLVSAIDSVWAQYCDSSSSDEAHMLHDNSKSFHKRSLSFGILNHIVPSSPVSLCGDEESYPSSNDTNDSEVNDNDEYEGEEDDDQRLRGASMDSRYYLSRSAPEKNSSKFPLVAFHAQSRSDRLLNLKQRLLKAKYYLAEMVDSLDPVSSNVFWRRWDMIKYSTIEVVEDEGDDDDTVEVTCQELEEGRYWRLSN